MLPLYVHAQCAIVTGNGLSVCSNIASFPNTRHINNTTHLWTTSGTGSISAPANLGIVYTPSAADLTAGVVVLTLAGSNGPSCANSSDTIMVIFKNAPVFYNSEIDRSQCFASSYVHAAYGLLPQALPGQATVQERSLQAIKKILYIYHKA